MKGNVKPQDCSPFLGQAAGAILVWIAIAALAQNGASGFLQALALILACSYLLMIWMYASAKPGVAMSGFLLAIAAAAWLLLARTYLHPVLLLRDASLIICSIFLVRWLLVARSRRGHPAPSVLSIVTIGTLVSWTAISFADVLSERALAAETAPAERINLGGQWGVRRVGVALSGGGFRAAVYHAGVLHALDRLQVPVSHLSTVSGGSIIGAHYWAGGRPADFAAAVRDGRFNLKRRLLLGHNALRLPVPGRLPWLDVRLLPFGEFSRLDVQAEQIRRLVLDRGPGPAGHQPRWLVATTDLHYGFLVGFTTDGLLLVGGDIQEFYRFGETVRVQELPDRARQVAISGAFPFAFPSTRLDMEVAERDPVVGEDRPFLRRTLLLVDGGVGDNTGYKLLEAAGALASTSMGEPWRFDAALVSDAGAIFGIREKLDSAAALARLFDVRDQHVEDPVHSGLVEKARNRLGLGAERDLAVVTLRYGFGPPGRVFRSRGEIEELAPDGVAPRRSLLPEIRLLPAGVLRALVDTIPKARRPVAARALGTFLEAWAVADQSLVKPPPGVGPGPLPLQPQLPGERLTMFGSVDQCLKVPRTGPAVCEAVALRVAIVEEVSRSLEVFARTSTLEDQLSDKTVDHLFRLGQYQVLMQWPALQRVLAFTANTDSA